jgi:HD-like signal output (HDOD) protein
MSQNDADDIQDLSSKSQGGILGYVFPADTAVLTEARRLAVEKNVRVEDLATCVAQDPVLVIELLKIANNLFFAGGRQPINSIKTALLRLGSDVIVDTLNQIAEREQLTDPEIKKWLEIHRNRCKKCSILARMIAEVLAKNLADDAQTAGLLSFIGEMLAVVHFGQNYIRIAEEQPRTVVLYRLAQDHKYDSELTGVQYLARNGIPQTIHFAIENKGTTKLPERAVLKPLLAAAAEMLEYYDTDRWDKIAPGKKIPPKSAIRMIQLTEAQYLKLYERATQYLVTIESLDANHVSEQKEDTSVISFEEKKPAHDLTELDSDLNDLIGIGKKKNVLDKNIQKDESQRPKKDEKDVIKEQFGLNYKSSGKVRSELTTDVKQIMNASLNFDAARIAVSKITKGIEDIQNSQELIAKILGALVDNGTFKKTALLVVSSDKKNAMVVAARGLDKNQAGIKMLIEGDISPISQSISKIQSFGSTASKESPFGSRTYALSPIDADHETPVFLYADCGNEGSITFEARRVFRTVVEILNKKLPSLPGGIPVELE